MKEKKHINMNELSEAVLSILESVHEESGLGTSQDTRPIQSAVGKTIACLEEYTKNTEMKNANIKIPCAKTIEYCDGFISEAGESHSNSTKQLVSLLNRPHIRGLLWSTEDISAERFAPELPPVPYEVDEDDGIAVKVVRIVKRDEPLGATIKCDNGKVFVARVIAGGVADRSACIQEGDRVMEVNGVSVEGKRADEIVALLNNCEGNCVTFKLIPAQLSKNQNLAEQNFVHLRATFDYDGVGDLRHPCPEAALSFKKGDILEILVCTDDHWWQARCIGGGCIFPKGERSRNKKVGLIPSEWLQQKTQGTKGKDSEDEIFYESVCRWYNNPKLTRCIILIGAPGVGRNELKRRLLLVYPERFSTTVPHTSRLPRPTEKEAVDYHFTTRQHMESMIENDEMLEFGEYRGNLYGTSIHSVRAAQKRATPLLSPHPLALRHLRVAQFAPIVIFVQPPSVQLFKETREAHKSRGGGRMFSDAEVEQIVDNSNQLERAHGHLFDAKITNGNLEEAMAELVKVLKMVDKDPTWVPLRWATRK